MSYITQLALIARFGRRRLIELTDRADEPTGDIDAAVIDRAIRDADAMIDGYIAVRYQLPVAEVPVLLEDISAKIAYYNLHIYDPDPKVTNDYRTALQQLGQIGRGELRLDIAGVEPSTSGASSAQITDRVRPLSNDSLKGFI